MHIFFASFLILFLSQFELGAEHRLFSLEMESGKSWLRSYAHPIGYADGEVARRKLNAVLPNVGPESKLEVAEFGQSWGSWQLVTASYEAQKVLIQSFAAPRALEQSELQLLSSIEVTSVHGEVLDLDFLAFDGLDLGYDQIHLFCSTASGHYMVTLVAPTQPKGQWRQSNWRKLNYPWPEKGFQLVKYEQAEWALFSSISGDLLQSGLSNEVHKTHFEYTKEDDVYLDLGREDQYCVLGAKKRTYHVIDAGSLKPTTRVSMEFGGDIVDVVSLELLDKPPVPSLQPHIYFTQSVRLNDDGMPWSNWPEEDASFKALFQMCYQGEKILDRGQLSYRIWWKAPSPSWDLQEVPPVPDQQGYVRRPLEPGDKVEFTSELLWPYEWSNGKWVDQSTKSRVPYWSIIVIESSSGDLRARSTIPWLARPMRCYAEFRDFEQLEQMYFFNSLAPMWRHRGGRESQLPYFEGFFDQKDLNNQALFSVTRENFWADLQPWSSRAMNKFDDLWIASWNQAEDHFKWPNWKGKTDLFSSWEIEIELIDGHALKRGVWYLENEFGERVLQRNIKDGLVRVLKPGQEDDMHKLWSSQKLFEVIEDHDRDRLYRVRPNQGRSGAEKIGWLWVEQGSRLIEKHKLPWGSHGGKWEPVKELFLYQGDWHFRLSDPESPELSLITETSEGRFEKSYPFEWGNIQMPLLLSYGETIHSVWLKRKKGAESLWSRAMHLFPIDKVLSIKENLDHSSSWLVQAKESQFLLNWRGMNCEKFLGLEKLNNYGIVRLCKDLPGTWLVQLERAYHGHHLLTWAPQFDEEQVLGGDAGSLKNIGDFGIFGAIEERRVVAGDLDHHALNLYSSEWELLDQWKKPGFSPVAMIRDPLAPEEFWVLDRRSTGQSFLYLFELLEAKIVLKKVVLEPLSLEVSNAKKFVGMALSVDKNGKRTFAFSDPNNKRVLEYQLENASFRLRKMAEYSKSILQQGAKPLLMPTDLIYLGPDHAKQLYVVDDSMSFVRVR